MHAAPSLPCGREIRLHRHVQLRRRATLAHLVDVHGVLRVLRMRIGAHGPHVHDRGQHRVGRRRSGTLSVIGPSPRTWCSDGTGLFAQGCALACPAIVDEAEALAFGILEIERQPAVALGDLAVLHTMLVEMLLPPVERLRAGNAERRARNRMRAAPLRRRRPVEEGDVGAGGREAVGVEEVIGADVVLVDGLLDEPHAEHALVEAAVARRVGRDRGQVVDAFELHDALRPEGPYQVGCLRILRRPPAMFQRDRRRNRRTAVTIWLYSRVSIENFAGHVIHPADCIRTGKLVCSAGGRAGMDAKAPTSTMSDLSRGDAAHAVIRHKVVSGLVQRTAEALQARHSFPSTVGRL